MQFDLEKLVRPNILNLKPYSSARNEFRGEGKVFLDANENALGSVLSENYNRYPDPLQSKIKNKIAQLKNLDSNHIFVGNGSDEAIDLLIRIFCRPDRDHIITLPPTYSMYEVSANINDVACKQVFLNDDFSLNVPEILRNTDIYTKIIFICSPNNPTGNIMDLSDIRYLCANFAGIVVIDEAYIDFAEEPSAINLLNLYPNLLVLQTFSKAWGLANLRVGLLYASKEIVALLNKIKPPYNVNGVSQRLILEALENKSKKKEYAQILIAERKKLASSLESLGFVETVYPSQANFLLIKVKDANSLYQDLLLKGIIVRNRSKEALCKNCLRITVGTQEENQILLDILNQLSK